MVQSFEREMYFEEPKALFELFDQIDFENVFLIKNNQELETNLEHLRNDNTSKMQTLTNELNEKKANRDRLRIHLNVGKSTSDQKNEDETDSANDIIALNNRLEAKIEHTYQNLFKLQEKKESEYMLAKIENKIQGLKENFTK